MWSRTAYPDNAYSMTVGKRRVYAITRLQYRYYDIMQERVKLKNLPPSMAERAVKARQLACQNPKDIDIDDEMLPWIFDVEDALWYSFDGNYSATSPQEKRESAQRYKRKQEEYEQLERARATCYIAWSIIRKKVLERDKYTCQICGNIKTSPLHIHHIMKRTQGGTDHIDMLITVCNKCHSKVDNVLYNPDWTANPDIKNNEISRTL